MRILPPFEEKIRLAREMVEAAKSVVMLDLAVLKCRGRSRDVREAGQRTGEVSALRVATRRHPRGLIAAWQRVGLLPRGTIEQMVPEKRLWQHVAGICYSSVKRGTR